MLLTNLINCVNYYQTRGICFYLTFVFVGGETVTYFQGALIKKEEYQETRNLPAPDISKSIASTEKSALLVWQPEVYLVQSFFFKQFMLFGD